MTGKINQNKTVFNVRWDVLVCLFLAIFTLSVYWQVRNYQFINYDDDEYITENRHVQAGLTLEGIQWAFTSNRASNWHPLTWLSLMLDCQLYGMDPGSYHMTNVLFHIMNTLLLFVVFRRMTEDLWMSGFVAAIFALHPLHVESVAWIVERKDVLSTFFWMLIMWSYIWYVERPGINRYLLVLFCFILGLMTKPMLVTLPFVLLLLDYWPLSRIQFGQSDGLNNAPQWPLIFRLIWEKIPFLIFIIASSVVTFIVQKSGGAVASIDVYPMNVRISNAIVSYVRYIGKMAWPYNLSVLYPHSGEPSLWQVAGATLVLSSISLLVIRYVKRHPYLVVGWLWYIGTLVPVIGLVQVGLHNIADRYTYVPIIGIAIMIAWGTTGLLSGWRYQRIVLATSSSAILLIFMLTTFLQVRYWANSITLFEHTLNVTVNNYLAHNNLGFALAGKGRTTEAINHYYKALMINPDCEVAHNNLGIAFASQKKYDKAIYHYSRSLRINPDYAEAHNNMGIVLVKQGRISEAISHYSTALDLIPDYAEAHNNLGVAFASQEDYDKAIYHYSRSLRINPGYAGAHNNLGIAFFHKGETDKAIVHLKESLRVYPGNVKVHNNLGNILAVNGRLDEAIARFSEALRLKPDSVSARKKLQEALKKQRESTIGAKK